MGELLLYVFYGLALAGQPAVLLEPQAALEHARSLEAKTPTLAAEIQLLAKDPRSALDTLESQDKLKKGPRWLRLEADAMVALGDTPRATNRLKALGKHPGWKKHAAQTLARLKVRARDDALVRVGTILFAMAIALLALGGARELLKPSVDTLIFAGAVALSACLIFYASPSFGVIFGVFSASVLGLVHGASSTIRRTAAGARGRVLLVTLVLLGTLGAGVAIVAQLGIPALVSLV